MFELIILIAIVGGIWYYFNSQEEVSTNDTASVEKVEETVVEPAETEEVQIKVEVAEEAAIEVVAENAVKSVVEPVKSKFVAGMPEDSSLKRHYQQLVTVNQAASNRIPEESVLRRHFLQNLISEEEACLAGVPTDSTLVRHYETIVTDAVVAKLESLK